jgi:hypothetical protein
MVMPVIALTGMMTRAAPTPRNPGRGTEGPHLVLDVIDHQAMDGAYPEHRVIRDFPAPDVLSGACYRGVDGRESPQCRRCNARPPYLALYLEHTRIPVAPPVIVPSSAQPIAGPTTAFQTHTPRGQQSDTAA